MRCKKSKDEIHFFAKRICDGVTQARFFKQKFNQIEIIILLDTNLYLFK